MTNRDVIDAFFAAMAARDFAGQAALLHPDFVLYEPASLPYGGEWRGAEGWRNFARTVVKAFGGFRNERLAVVGAPDDAMQVLHMRISGKSLATSREFTLEVLEYWRFADGKVLEMKPFYFDTHVIATLDA